VVLVVLVRLVRLVPLRPRRDEHQLPNEANEPVTVPQERRQPR
jgi:hypothetical protein